VLDGSAHFLLDNSAPASDFGKVARSSEGKEGTRSDSSEQVSHTFCRSSQQCHGNYTSQRSESTTALKPSALTADNSVASGDESDGSKEDDEQDDDGDDGSGNGVEEGSTPQPNNQGTILANNGIPKELVPQPQCVMANYTVASQISGMPVQPVFVIQPTFNKYYYQSTPAPQPRPSASLSNKPSIGRTPAAKVGKHRSITAPSRARGSARAYILTASDTTMQSPKSAGVIIRLSGSFPSSDAPATHK
jgi:hypothetical protein